MQYIERPLVSCICITFKRVNFLQNAISCFLQQTYPNKELIVGYTEDDHETHAYLTGVNDLSVIPLRFQSSMSLGEKRNLAVEFCSGVYFITWDDDDWHHQSRIEMQVQHLIGTGFKCSALSSIILFDGMTNEAYVSATRWGWEGTLLCEKTVIKELSFRYEPLNQGEDSPLLYQLKINDFLIGFLNQLYTCITTMGKIHVIANTGK